MTGYSGSCKFFLIQRLFHQKHKLSYDPTKRKTKRTQQQQEHTHVHPNDRYRSNKLYIACLSRPFFIFSSESKRRKITNKQLNTTKENIKSNFNEYISTIFIIITWNTISCCLIL